MKKIIGALLVIGCMAATCANAAPKSKAELQEQLARDTSMIKESPTAINYGERAGTYIDLEMWKEALADLDQAVKLNAKYALYHTSRGVVLIHLGRYREAISECTTAFNLAKPGDKERISALRLRSVAYSKSGDRTKSDADLAAIERLKVTP